MSILYIAEKPTVAKAIANELGVTSKGDGFIECGKDKVTWCFGHMLEQCEPDEYTPDDVPITKSGNKIWRVDELPIIPTTWKLKPKKEAEKQLKLIGKLLKSASSVVHAGDPDREGNLLVDDVLEHHNNNLPVKRYWVSAQDAVSVQRGLSSLKDNNTFKGWSNAARGRQRADWLIGMNLSRAYTLKAQRGGSRTLLAVGRVQTPTLAMVVSRDREIKNFKSIPFYGIKAKFHHENGDFIAKWVPSSEQAGIDSEGRLIDPVIADDLSAALKGKQGEVFDYSQKPGKKGQPLSFSLSDITALASKKYGYGADEVLKICQSLYEVHKLTSYPRTGCAYLPESQHADAKQVIKAVSETNKEYLQYANKADPSIKSKTWNDKKITAHHGIIPTMHVGNIERLSEAERNIYDLVVRGYLAQFYPPHEYLQTDITIKVDQQEFTATGRQVVANGWLDVYQATSEDDDKESDKDDSQALPRVTNGDPISCVMSERRDSKTKPPSHFTEGTLIKAMENIHRFVADSNHKKMLKDGDGIGTDATRASIIAELKKRELLAVKGKKIVSTEIGQSIIDVLPEMVTSPVLTSLFERVLLSVQSGDTTLDSFVSKQEEFIKKQVQIANEGSVKIKGEKDPIKISTKYKCRACNSGLARRASSKKGKFWWSCSNYPDCTQTYPDVKGIPNYSKG